MKNVGGSFCCLVGVCVQGRHCGIGLKRKYQARKDKAEVGVSHVKPKQNSTKALNTSFHQVNSDSELESLIKTRQPIKRVYLNMARGQASQKESLLPTLLFGGDLLRRLLLLFDFESYVGQFLCTNKHSLHNITCN